MALFDSDDFEEYELLTETEKIDLALALILDKRTRNEKIDFFFNDSKKKSLLCLQNTDKSNRQNTSKQHTEC